MIQDVDKIACSMQVRHRVVKDLLAMGYRFVRREGKCAMLKPIGFSLFIFKMDGRLYQYFRGMDRSLSCMQSWDLDSSDDPTVTIIKLAENYHHRVSTHESHFEFRTDTAANCLVCQLEEEL